MPKGHVQVFNSDKDEATVQLSKYFKKTANSIVLERSRFPYSMLDLFPPEVTF